MGKLQAGVYKTFTFGFVFFFFLALAEASPFKEGDESSVDIYDGLDNGLTVPGRLIVSCCLSWSFIESLCFLGWFQVNQFYI